ncbi:hypothetical protein DPMN_029769 [Dreissena polymorpha]|uniref:Uncharacterized protein n=1 Tax=Dreissena polymorpha TaxID=45954 RepID=A0A9D4RHP8_DREPO|nr:hypothetical protein DPMN_029769 [Dreissena polymorpha]
MKTLFYQTTRLKTSLYSENFRLLQATCVDSTARKHYWKHYRQKMVRAIRSQRPSDFHELEIW